MGTLNGAVDSVGLKSSFKCFAKEHGLVDTRLVIYIAFGLMLRMRSGFGV